MAHTHEFKVKNECDEPYIRLSAAILSQAMRDLAHELRYGNEKKANALKKWFLSDYGQSLSFGQGEYLIEQVQKSIKKENRK